MHEYEKVNNEIKDFLNMQESRPTILNEEKEKSFTEKNELIRLLSDLLEIYKEIQNSLETKDFENVKDKIITSDVKNALVCESLMKILKDECTEKAEIKKQFQNEKSRNKQFEDEKNDLKLKISKLESELDFSKRSNHEISRIVKDQKNLLIAAKEKAELERKACESVKNINKELEILRGKAYDKVNTIEKEIKVLKDKLIEKDKNIKSFQMTIKEIENEKDNLNKKILNYEKTNENLKKKIEMKDNALSICNAELAKIISKDKKNEEVLEEIKEKASYYERLYKATNKQNEYLNAQLAKLITHENVDKLEKEPILSNSEISLVTTQSKEQIYKKKLKKYKKKYNFNKINEEKKDLKIDEISKAIDKIKLENEKLKKEKESAVKGNNEISKTLMNKIESLLEQNRKYQNMLIDTKNNENFKIRESLENLKVASQFEKKDEIFDESFKTVKEESENYINLKDHRYSIDLKNEELQNFTNPKNIKDFENQKKQTDFRYDDIFDINGKVKIKGEDDSTLFVHSNKYRRPFNLANDYEDVPATNTNNLKTSIFNIHPPKKEKSFSFANKKSENLPSLGIKEDEEVKSVESSKSVKTSSSLKDMLKKTENLQNKFDNLEKQLEEINEKDLPVTKKLQDQIRAYTDYYYSDYLDFSNENDIL